MGKINFTKEHLANLKANIAELVLNGTIINGPMGQSYDIFNIVNTLSIASNHSLHLRALAVRGHRSATDIFEESSRGLLLSVTAQHGDVDYCLPCFAEFS